MIPGFARTAATAAALVRNMLKAGESARQSQSDSLERLWQAHKSPEAIRQHAEANAAFVLALRALNHECCDCGKACENRICATCLEARR